MSCGSILLRSAHCGFSLLPSSTHLVQFTQQTHTMHFNYILHSGPEAKLYSYNTCSQVMLLNSIHLIVVNHVGGGNTLLQFWLVKQTIRVFSNFLPELAHNRQCSRAEATSNASLLRDGSFSANVKKKLEH